MFAKYTFASFSLSPIFSKTFFNIRQFKVVVEIFDSERVSL